MDFRELSEDEVEAIVQAVTPIIRKEVRGEVTVQLAGFGARLSSIEAQAASNGEQTTASRMETAGVAAMLTAFFGTDGTGGTVGILIKNSVGDAKRANDLAHKIFGHLDVLVGRGWLNKQIADEAGAVSEKKRDKRWAVVRWGAGAVLGGGALARGWVVVKAWLATHLR